MLIKEEKWISIKKKGRKVVRRRSKHHRRRRKARRENESVRISVVEIMEKGKLKHSKEHVELQYLRSKTQSLTITIAAWDT